MNTQNLYIDRWKALPLAEKEALAKALLKTLPAGWQYIGLEYHALGGQENDIAFFTWQDRKFALVPGNRQAVLGYDRKKPFVMNEEQLKEWHKYNKYFLLRLLRSYKLFIRKSLTHLRTISIAPLLIQVNVDDEELEQILVHDPISYNPKPDLEDAFLRFKQFAHRAYKEGETRVYHEEDGQFYAIPQANQTVIVYRVIHKGRTAKLQEWAANGFCLLMPDEWEYACAAGTRTLWRWGDEYPLELPNYWWNTEEQTWKKHKQPNAFGILMPHTPYKWEDTNIIGEYRGGNGDVFCQEASVFKYWIALSSFFRPTGLHKAHYHPESLGSNLRRVFPLEKRIQL